MLDDISFRVEPGETTAIIGSTGAGKTTIVNLVTRLFDATAGTVLVDGVDVRRLAPELLWGRIGYVPQQAYLFSGTVASNLRFGRPDATDDELWEALEIAQASDFVQAMPDGIESEITRAARTCRAASDSGWRSPGRSSCDPRSTCSTTRSRRSTSPPMPGCAPALAPRIADAAVLIVAQRVSTIRHADQILVLDDGRVRGHRHARRTARELRRPTPRSSPPSCRGSRDAIERRAQRRGLGPRRSSPPPARQARRGPFGPGGGVAVPVERSDAVRRDRAPARQRSSARSSRGSLLVLALTIGGVALVVLGPRLLGQATDIIVERRHQRRRASTSARSIAS